MFCVLVVAARPKIRMSTETMRSIAVTMIDFLFLLLKEPVRAEKKKQEIMAFFFFTNVKFTIKTVLKTSNNEYEDNMKNVKEVYC